MEIQAAVLAQHCVFSEPVNHIYQVISLFCFVSFQFKLWIKLFSIFYLFLDTRIQAFFDHCNGDDLKSFNPFHILKWIGILI